MPARAATSPGQDWTALSAPNGGERPYDCRMPVRFLHVQSPHARAALIATLLLVPLCVAPTATARWSAPARPAGCSAVLPGAVAPLVVFPSADPTARSGPGALLWTAPLGCAVGRSASEAVGATLGGDDIPGIGRPLAVGGGGLTEVATAAGTATGQVVAVDSSALAEGRTAGTFGAARPLGGPVAPVAPVAASSAFLGDVAIAFPVRTRTGWAIAVRVQRHYSESLGHERLVPVGAKPVDAVAATMDYRAEVLLVWASGGAVNARELSPAGALGPVHLLGSLAAGSSDPELQALVSDDGHAIVAWRSQSVAPGGAPSTTIELNISGGDLAFGTPRVLESFRDLGGFVPPAGSLRLLRLSSEAVMLAWTGVDAGRYVVRASPVSLRRGAWAPVIISGRGSASGWAGTNGAPASGRQPDAGHAPPSERQSDAGHAPASERQPDAGHAPPSERQLDAGHAPASERQPDTGRAPSTDAVLADIAAGPDAEAFALWRTAPSSAGGAPRAGSASWAIRASRGHYAGQGEVSFAASELVAAPGPNGPPAVAVDPASGRALAAWVTFAGGSGVGHIEYALRAAGSPSAPPPAVASVTHTARRVGDHGGTSLVVDLSALVVLALAGAGALLFVVTRRPGHMRARRG